MFLGDQATADDLRESLEATARQAREFHAKGYPLIQEALDTGGPFPERLHLIEPMIGFLNDFYRLLIQWCERTITEMDDWRDTRDVGLTPEGRQRLERILAQPDP